MELNVELEVKNAGRWLAEVPDLPGVMAYGRDRALALRVIADRIENGEWSDDPATLTFTAA